MMRTALTDFAVGRGDGPRIEVRGLRVRDVQQAEDALRDEEPTLFEHVKRSFYEDGKVWWANMDDSDWAAHHAAKKS